MAVVKKLLRKKLKAGNGGSKPSLRVVLPEEATEPSDLLSDYSFLLYGAKKIGKTTLAAQFPDPFFLATEPGTKALRVKALQVRDWPTAVGAMDALEERLARDADYCKTVVVDTTDLLYEYAFDYVCKVKMIGHPHEENDYGATWREIKVAFRNYLMRLVRLQIGTVLISHEVEREIELADGRKVDRVQPSLSNQPLGEVEGLVDLIGYYGFQGRHRTLRIRGAQTLVAGSRLREHFLIKGGDPEDPKARVQAIPLGRTEREAYEALVQAFNNQQENAGLEEEPQAAKKVVLKKRK